MKNVRKPERERTQSTIAINRLILTKTIKRTFRLNAYVCVHVRVYIFYGYFYTLWFGHCKNCESAWLWALFGIGQKMRMRMIKHDTLTPSKHMFFVLSHWRRTKFNKEKFTIEPAQIFHLVIASRLLMKYDKNGLLLKMFRLSFSSWHTKNMQTSNKPNCQNFKHSFRIISQWIKRWKQKEGRNRQIIIHFWWVEYWKWLSSQVLIHFISGFFSLQWFVRSLFVQKLQSKEKKYLHFFTKLCFVHEIFSKVVFSHLFVLESVKYGPIRCRIVIFWNEVLAEMRMGTEARGEKKG